jgi:flagellar protein FlaJ
VIEKRDIKIGWAVSCGVGFAIIFLALLGPYFFGLPEFLGLFKLLGIPYFLPSYLGVLWVDKLMVISVVIMILPPGVLHHLHWRWKKAVDRNVPNFLRDIANAQYTGMTFIRALEYTAKRDYGPLSEHLRWALAKISWGVPYEEALQAMAERLDTPLVRRAVMLIIESGRTGGDILEIMESIAKHIRNVEDLERERLTSMRPNIYIIYLGFAVMLLTVVLVYTTFILRLLTGELAGSIGAIRAQESPLTPLEYLRIYFHTAVVVAFFGGLMAGQMGEGGLTNGLKHSVIMLIATLLTFTFFMA